MGAAKQFVYELEPMVNVVELNPHGKHGLMDVSPLKKLTAHREQPAGDTPVDPTSQLVWALALSTRNRSRRISLIFYHRPQSNQFYNI